MCNCQTKQRQLKANLLAGEAKRVSYEGRQTLIVPVVMARADVVMNDGIVPVEEMVPYAWNGVAVTVGHPQASDGTSLPATLRVDSSLAVNVFASLRGESPMLNGRAQRLLPET